MGGNALSKPSERLSKEEFNFLKSSIIKLFDNTDRMKVIESYSDKKSFGDMDILYYKISVDDIIYKLSRQYKVVESVNNGNVTSIGILFDSKLFQLDFIKSNYSEFHFAYKYFAFNDLGNLIGRVARACGLKFGHNGLWYIQRDGDQILYKHLLSLDFYYVLEYLGFDSERYKKGFKTLEDMFEFVMSSDYYDFNHFDLSQRNYKARTRDRKRPNYNAFLEYVKTHPKENNIKPLTIEDHIENFPYFKIKYKSIEIKNKNHKIYKDKFNGNLLMELTGLEGKELGKFMGYCKQCPEFSIRYVIKSDKKDINNNIIKAFEEYKRSKLKWVF